MKQELFLDELEIALTYSDVADYWSDIFKEFLVLCVKTNDINKKTYLYLVKFNNILIELSNKFPLFFECGNPEQLDIYLNEVSKNITHSIPLDFLWNKLCEYLHTFTVNNSNYNIEVNELSELLDSLLYILEDELQIEYK